MSAAEFDLWRAVDTISPIGPERQDQLVALICSVLANIHRDPARRPTPYTLADFDLYRERPQLTRAEEEARARAAFIASGGRVVRG